MDRKLNSNIGFTHMWIVWKLLGIFPIKNHKRLYRSYGLVLNLFSGILSPISVFVNVFYLRDIALIIRNLQCSVLLFVASIKLIIIWPKLPDLQKAELIFQRLDERTKTNKEETQYLHGIIKQCRLIVGTIEILFFISFFLYPYPSLSERKLIFDGWMSSDSEWVASNMLYTLALILQILPAFLQMMLNVASDTYPLVCLSLLRAHTHTLCMRVARIGNDKRRPFKENFSDLKSCVNDHRDIVRLLETVKPAISQTVLVQLIVTGVILCLSIFYYEKFDRELGQLISVSFYVACTLFVSFPVCYFANSLMSEIDKLTSSIFSNNWIEMPMAFKKCIIIFMQRSQLTMMIYAGGLVAITLQTFISIIRFSFSMFTVLKQVSQEAVLHANGNYTKQL